MKIRGTGLALLVLCVLGGLIALLFTPAIAATLTVPATPGLSRSGGGTGAQTHPTAVVTAPASTPTTRPAATTPAQATQATNGVVTLAQDNFQRPDQVFWGTSSGLRAWSGDANKNPSFAIVDHAGQIAGGQSSQAAQGALQAVLDVGSADADILVTGSVSQFDANGDTNLGAVLRWQDANNWYKALIDGSHLQLLKSVKGKISVLASQTFQASSGVNYNLRFRALGSSLFAKAWAGDQQEPATWMLMQTDTQFTNGMSGIRVKVVSGMQIRITAFKETSVPNIM